MQVQPQPETTNINNLLVNAFDDHNVTIYGTWEEPLFKASEIGEMLGIKDINSVIRNFGKDKGMHSTHTPGGVQETTFITETGLYKVLFKSRKQIATKFQEHVSKLLKDQRIQMGKDIENSFQKQIENQKLEIQQITESRSKDKQNLLLEKFGNSGALVYIVKVKQREDGTYVVKIGESRNGIEQRFSSHKTEYGYDIELLDCFPVNNSKDLESFIHGQLRDHKVKDLQGHENENELFLVGTGLTYKHILELVEKNIHRYNDNYVEVEKLKLENERLNILNTLLSNNDFSKILEELLNGKKHMINRLDNIDNKLDELICDKNRQTASIVSSFNEPLQTLGPRLQKINPETFKLVKVYESTSEAIKETGNKLKRSSINKAVKENTVYHGFRWCLVDRDLDPSIVNIEKTKVTKIQNNGYICKLNKEKTMILNVYLNRCEASLANGYKSSAYLDAIVKRESLANGYYYKLYDSCDKELKYEFEKKHGIPVLYKNGIGKFTENGELVKEFVSKMDCYTQDTIGNKSLTRALNDSKECNGYIYKFLEQKTQMIKEN